MAAVLFDLYGTLVDIAIDTKPPELWQQLCSELLHDGVQLEPAGLHRRYDQLVRQEEKEHGEAFVMDRLFFTKLLEPGSPADPELPWRFGRRFRELTTGSLSVRDYALPLLRSLREDGCKLALVTNTEETVTSHDLDVTGLREHFDAIVISSSVGSKKPERTIFEIALERLGVTPQQAIFIGDDNVADLGGATAVGMRAILLCHNSGRRPYPGCIPPEMSSIMAALSAHTSSRVPVV